MKKEIEHSRQHLLDVVPLAAPFIIAIEPSGCCNFKCHFCPCNNSDYKYKERHVTMGLDLFKKIVCDIAALDEKPKVIELGGCGESLLNQHLPEMIKIIKEKNLCREIRLVTNGSLLTPKLNRELVDSGLDLLRLSIEALSSEGYYHVTGVHVDYENFLRNIEDLYNYSKKWGGGGDIDIRKNHLNRHFPQGGWIRQIYSHIQKYHRCLFY